MEKRKDKIIKAIFTKPYIWAFIIIFLGFMALTIWLNESYYFFSNISSFRSWFIISFLFFSILIPGLVALNINLAWIRLSSLGVFESSVGGLTITGTIASLIGGGCPACIAGLFPTFMGLFGISASLSSLPFLGIEIQLVSVALLTLSIIVLTKDPVCKIKKPLR